MNNVIKIVRKLKSTIKSLVSALLTGSPHGTNIYAGDLSNPQNNSLLFVTNVTKKKRKKKTKKDAKPKQERVEHDDCELCQRKELYGC